MNPFFSLAGSPADRKPLSSISGIAARYGAASDFGYPFFQWPGRRLHHPPFSQGSPCLSVHGDAIRPPCGRRGVRFTHVADTGRPFFRSLIWTY